VPKTGVFETSIYLLKKLSPKEGNLTQKVIKNRRNLLKPAYKQGLAPISHS